jgi:hypothetical protein
LTYWTRHSQAVRIETSKKKGKENLGFDATADDNAANDTNGISRAADAGGSNGDTGVVGSGQPLGQFYSNLPPAVFYVSCRPTRGQIQKLSF